MANRHYQPWFPGIPLYLYGCQIIKERRANWSCKGEHFIQPNRMPLESLYPSGWEVMSARCFPVRPLPRTLARFAYLIAPPSLTETWSSSTAKLTVDQTHVIRLPLNGNVKRVTTGGAHNVALFSWKWDLIAHLYPCEEHLLELAIMATLVPHVR
ncbi:hypothetical protein ACFX11_008875 [Malus domestica]